MTLSFVELQIIEEIADVLYEFLPASGNTKTSFPIAANKVKVQEYWPEGNSKRPSIVHLIREIMNNKRHMMGPLLIEVISQSLTWRKNKSNPLQYSEITRLNQLLLKLNIKIPEINDKNFLSSLAGAESGQSIPSVAVAEVNSQDLDKLKNDFSALINLTDAQARGYKFEIFLAALFRAYKLNPRESFKQKGEQIDGSFDYKGDIFLLEAKWQNEKVDGAKLLEFNARVEGKSAWSRGLIISYSGFTENGLDLFSKGRPTHVICVDGMDLHMMFAHNISFTELLDRKIRKAAETGRAFCSIRDLYDKVL